MRPLTPRQREVLCCICDFCRERQYPPTRRELAARLGTRSPRIVEYHLRVLHRKGLLWAGRERRGRAIRVTTPGCVYCGTVQIPAAAAPSTPRATRAPAAR